MTTGTCIHAEAQASTQLNLELELELASEYPSYVLSASTPFQESEAHNQGYCNIPKRGESRVVAQCSWYDVNLTQGRSQNRCQVMSFSLDLSSTYLRS